MKQKKHEIGLKQHSKFKDGLRHTELLLNGIHLKELVERLDECNHSQDEENVKERNELKGILFEYFRNIDNQQIFPLSVYNTLRENGVSKKDIEYDVQKVEQDVRREWRTYGKVLK